eukprot:s386_g9.t1
MATILEPEAAFNARAIEHALTRPQLVRLQNQGLVKLAFALTTPGTVPADEALRGLLDDDPDAVTVGQLSSVRRLMFDAQTLAASQIKTTITGTDAGKKAELVPAERAQRIQNQKQRLQGMELTGPLECSHASYDYVAKMLEGDVPIYLEPHRFTTRASEVAREKPGKEIVLDNTNLTVKDIENKDRCQISNELQLHQAFTRRALACDLMQACTFRRMEKWHRFLLDHLQQPAPPNFRAASMEQVLRADRAAWIKMAERVHSLKRAADGALPLDNALDELQVNPSVVFHLMPVPQDRQQAPTKTPPVHAHEAGGGQPLNIKKKDKFGKNQQKGGNKGRGKGKGKPASKGRMPLELVGLHRQNKAGKRLPWLVGPHLNQALKTSLMSRLGNLSLTEGSSAILSTMFSKKFSDRVRDRPLSALKLIEVFSGTGGLTAEVRRPGCHHSVGVDAHVTKQVKAPVIRIDLASQHGESLFWRILRQPDVFAIHLGPPCASRARGNKRSKGANPPLRSTKMPDGLPGLPPTYAARVATANCLYKLCGRIMSFATSAGILCTIENPARSHFWATSFLQRELEPVKQLLQEVHFHHCMYKSRRRKRTRLLVNHSCFLHLAKDCDDARPHGGWGSTPQHATSLEVEYPHELSNGLYVSGVPQFSMVL